LESFFDLTDHPIDKALAFPEVLQLAKNSLDYKEEEYDLSIQSQIKHIEDQRTSLVARSQLLKEQLVDLNAYSNNGTDYRKMILKYVSKSNEIQDQSIANGKYICPLCRNEVKELSDEALKIKEGTNLLREELSRIPQNKRSIDDLFKSLQNEKHDIDISIKELNNGLRIKKEVLSKIIKGKNINDLRLKQKSKVLASLEMYNTFKKSI
jgi:hypothetical protein